MSVQSKSQVDAFPPLVPLCRGCSKELREVDHKISECVRCHMHLWCSFKCRVKEHPNHRKFCDNNSASTDKEQKRFTYIFQEGGALMIYLYFTRALLSTSARDYPVTSYVYFAASYPKPVSYLLSTIRIRFPKLIGHKKISELKYELGRQKNALCALYRVGASYQVYVLGGKRLAYAKAQFYQMPNNLLTQVKLALDELHKKHPPVKDSLEALSIILKDSSATIDAAERRNSLRRQIREKTKERQGYRHTKSHTRKKKKKRKKIAPARKRAEATLGRKVHT